MEWYEKAATQGNSDARQRLAERGIKLSAPLPKGSGTTEEAAPAVASSKVTDSFDGKTLHGEKREGPTVKGMQLGMHITEARDVLSQQAEKILAMKFRVVKYEDGYGIRATSTEPANKDDFMQLLNQPTQLLAGIERNMNNGKEVYFPGVNEVYVFAGKDGIVKALGFPPFVVAKLFAEVSDLPTDQFAAQFAKAYKISFTDVSISSDNEPIFNCVTADGVIINVSQKLKEMKSIEIYKKDVRGAKGFN